MDAGTGKLTPKGEVPVAGGPSPLTMSPDRKVLYVGHRNVPGISSFRIDPDTGALTQNGTVSPEAAPTFLSTDRTGRYVLSSYYQGAHAAVHPVGNDGAVGGPPIEWLETAIGAHAIQTDPSNKFAFVPHIDNRGGPNAIFQFKFDPNTGHLTPTHRLGWASRRGRDPATSASIPARTCSISPTSKALASPGTTSTPPTAP
jgi:6-phosphogluconolactonase